VARLSTERIVAIAVIGAAVFAVGMLLLVQHVTKTSREEALATVNANTAQMERARGTSMLDAAAAVASPFVAHVGRGEFADAYALLAAPYRDAVTLAAFTKACQASPILAEARAVTLNRLRQQTVGTAATVEGSGVLDSRSGGVPIAFVFLQEGGNLRILVVSLAGVPVLQGVAAR